MERGLGATIQDRPKYVLFKSIDTEEIALLWGCCDNMILQFDFAANPKILGLAFFVGGCFLGRGWL